MQAILALKARPSAVITVILATSLNRSSLEMTRSSNRLSPQKVLTLSLHLTSAFLGVIGASNPLNKSSRVSELANLVADDDDFLNEFGSNVDKVKSSKPKGGKPAGQMEQLL